MPTCLLLSFFVSFCRSTSVVLCLCRSTSVVLCLSLSVVSLPVSLFRSVSVGRASASFSLSLCLCLSVVPLPVSLFRSVSVCRSCLCQFLSFALALSVGRASASFSFSLCLSLEWTHFQTYSGLCSWGQGRVMMRISQFCFIQSVLLSSLFPAVCLSPALLLLLLLL